jgi:predicted patatin/cPLA2 family phospholipase
MSWKPPPSTGADESTIRARSRHRATGHRVGEMSTKRSLSRSCALGAALLVQACAAHPARNPVPEVLVHEATIPDFASVRIWGDGHAPDAGANDSLDRIAEQVMAASGPAAGYDMLVISGGGSDGAFGAGLLKGWSASGTRPRFRIVTGISTGALIAPFAFLGTEYDGALEELYTHSSRRDLMRLRPLGGLFGDSLADTRPLRDRIAQQINEAFVGAIAREHERGRRLLIGTTHLDAGRPMIWNIGAIATSGAPGAGELIRKVILASASIPGFFPPIRLEVEAGGRRYDELHVDGGVSTQAFLFPMSINLTATHARSEHRTRPKLYVIRNAPVMPTWHAVDQRLLPIARASILTQVVYQGNGDLYRLYLQAERNGFDYRAAWIPSDVKTDGGLTFEPEYMGVLFERGYRLGSEGNPWRSAPPGARIH